MLSIQLCIIVSGIDALETFGQNHCGSIHPATIPKFDVIKSKVKRSDFE